MGGIPSNLSNVFPEASSGFRGPVGGLVSQSDDAKRERLRVGFRTTLGGIVSDSGSTMRNVASGRLGEFGNMRKTRPAFITCALRHSQFHTHTVSSTIRSNNHVIQA